VTKLNSQLCWCC